jgi:hypothetical protein
MIPETKDARTQQLGIKAVAEYKRHGGYDE